MVEGGKVWPDHGEVCGRREDEEWRIRNIMVRRPKMRVHRGTGFLIFLPHEGMSVRGVRKRKRFPGLLS